MTPLLAQTVHDISASSMWILAYLVLAIVVILWGAWSGWQQGFLRKGGALFAILLGYVTAFLLGPKIAPLLATYFQYPILILAPIGGALAGSAVWFVMHIMSSILFKPAYDHDSPNVRFFSGSGGAALGMVVSFAYMVLLTSFIKLFGEISEFQLNSHQEAFNIAKLNSEERQKENDSPKAQVQDMLGELGINSDILDRRTVLMDHTKVDYNPPSEFSQSIMAGFAKMKNSIGKSAVSPVLATADPVPDKVYRLISKVHLMANNPEALARFKAHPLSQQMLKHPDMQVVINNQEVQDLANMRAVNNLFQHPAIIQAADNPNLLQLLKGFDVEKAMDDALELKQQHENLKKP